MLSRVKKQIRLAKAASAVFAGFAFSLLVLFGAVERAEAVTTLKTYYSSKNKDRPIRTSTRYIILHTTEGAALGSGKKLQRNGEAHYMVDTAGKIYRIIDRNRIARHCGRSMWNNTTSLDNCSVGIEVVGYHNKDLTAAQYKALKQLISELQSIYKIADANVLTHSMVAYGSPNRWHKKRHRGRKRCAMRMALPSVRRKLGLTSKPSYDPDVKAKRLVVADKELHQLLYSVEKTSKASTSKSTSQAKAKSSTKKAAASKDDSGDNVITKNRSAWDIARDAYNDVGTIYLFPDGTKKNGSEIKNWSSMQAGTRVYVGGIPESEKASKSDHPVITSGQVDEDEALARYVAREGDNNNVISATRSAWDIARDAYNAETTIYIFPDGTTKKGTEIKKWKSMKAGTRVVVAAGDANATEAPATLDDVAATSDDLKKQAKEILTELAGAEWNSERTIYLLPHGKYFKGNQVTLEWFATIPLETKVFNGYKIDGPITVKKRAFDICGPSWRNDDTYYLMPNGVLISGDKVNPKKIHVGTMVLFKD